MNKALVRSVVGVLAILAAASFLITSGKNRKLVKEKEALILRYDSLHMLQIQIKKELASSQRQIDSLKNKN